MWSLELYLFIYIFTDRYFLWGPDSDHDNDDTINNIPYNDNRYNIDDIDNCVSDYNCCDYYYTADGTNKR